MCISGMRSEQLLALQKEQFRHDKRNHSDILCLHKTDRLKHYGLHYCKYVGRLARGHRESKSENQTIVDALLVCLSAANTLHQELTVPINSQVLDQSNDLTLQFADAAGRFADACEKIDHLEEFLPIAKRANTDVLALILRLAANCQIGTSMESVQQRRAELAKRHFYIEGEI